jgi:cytochrome bd ubiquinol oxidase subunit I
MAFVLEVGFLGIIIFGWQRVPRLVHFLATSMVALGASLSAFWIVWVACLKTSLFVIGGISAWYVLRGRDGAFFGSLYLRPPWRS